jgi:hypothetical protein
MAKGKNGGKMSASEAGQKGGKAPHNKRGNRGSDNNSDND